MFLSLANTRGAKIKPILPTLPHRAPRALCGSIKKNTDSLVKGIILCDQEGGGEERGGKVMVESAPPVSPWSACFLLLFVQRIFSDKIIFVG